ncbi:MAG TPA: DUF1071 domain-containing protein [bacterium]|nr:DUF1071 domain-containing protein [bacterium]
MTTFAELSKINVNAHTEKKGELTYLSWAWAVDQLLQRDPTATWEYRFSDGKPFISIGETAMVFCTVNAFQVSRTAQLPVMDHRNKAIINPDSMQLNTAMQRALAKAIALHGIGLYIYAGEDLPAEEPKAAISDKQKADWKAGVQGIDDSEKLREFWKKAAASCQDSKDVEAYKEIKALVIKRADELRAKK